MASGISYFQYHLTQKVSEKLEEVGIDFNVRMKRADAQFQNDIKKSDPDFKRSMKR